MTSSRNYDDPCGIARALDVIGDRWALLVVRELIFGPKRFGQLRAGLPSISPNVLSQRLRELEEAGVVGRDLLAPPASVTVYRLTDRGRAIEPVLRELGRWGSQEPVTSSRELTPDALMVALTTSFDPRAAADAIYLAAVCGEVFTLAIAGGSLAISRGGDPSHADVSLHADAATMRAVAFGREPIAAAEAAGRLTVAGDRELAERFTRMFPVSQPQASARATTRNSPSLAPTGSLFQPP